MSSIKVGKYSIELSNEQKVIFPKQGITKGDLINYYQRIAPIMVPHMQERPISMQRFPDGITHEGFFQKDASGYFPSWITTKGIKKEDGTVVNYVVCDNAATLVYLANQLCITPHLWLSRIDKLDYPDRMIFDLDPSGTSFAVIMRAAKLLKNILEEYGLVPFVMTTGSRGLHVVVPLKRTQRFAAVRNFARTLAQAMADQDPTRYTIDVRKDKRQGRVFIDYLRNGFGATGVAPYAVRPKPGAPVATPLEWSEVKSGLSPQQYTIKNIFRRLARRNDPWHDIDNYARAL